MRQRPASSMPMAQSPIASPLPLPRQVVGARLPFPFRSFRPSLKPLPKNRLKVNLPLLNIDSPEFALHPVPRPDRETPILPMAEHAATALVIDPPRATRHVPDTHGALQALPPDWDRVDNLSALPDLRPLGQLHDSFIIAAAAMGYGSSVNMLPMSAFCLNRCCGSALKGAVQVQQLLMPLVLQLTPAQQFEYGRIADELSAYGFETEDVRTADDCDQSRARGRRCCRHRKDRLRNSRNRRNANCARPRSTRFAGTCAPPLPAARRSRST